MVTWVCSQGADVAGGEAGESFGGGDGEGAAAVGERPALHALTATARETNINKAIQAWDNPGFRWTFNFILSFPLDVLVAVFTTQNSSVLYPWEWSLNPVRSRHQWRCNNKAPQTNLPGLKTTP